MGRELYKDEKGNSLSLEGRYTDYGSYKISAKTGDIVTIENTKYPPLLVDISAELDISSFGVALVSQLYLNEYIDLVTNIGFHRWETDNQNIQIGNQTELLKDEDGTDLVYGLGLGFKVSDAVLIKLEYEVADFDGDEIKGGILSANFKF